MVVGVVRGSSSSRVAVVAEDELEEDDEELDELVRAVVAVPALVEKSVDLRAWYEPLVPARKESRPDKRTRWQ